MKHLNLTTMLLMAVATMMLTACEPENEPTPTVDPNGIVAEAEQPHLMVLGEGTWGGNNASLAWLDLAKGELTTDWFSTQNGRGLGDVAQDLIIYGSKAYATVWQSNSLEGIDTATGVSRRVDLGNRGPRYIAADGGKLYITCYKPHSVIRIDTATLEIEATCEPGDYNPEGIAVVGNKLLVASSNVSDEQGNYSYDNHVYLLNIASFSVLGKIEVGCNPQKVMSVGQWTAVVNCWGDYAGQPASVAFIDDAMQVTLLEQDLTNMTVANSHVYGYYTEWAPDYSSKTTRFVKIDTDTHNVTPILTDVDVNAYAIGVHPVSGNIYIADDGNYTANGDLYSYTPDGKLRWKREVGMLPSKVVFY